MEKLWAVFGKIILAVIVLGALIGGGVYIGLKASKNSAPQNITVHVTQAPNQPTVSQSPNLSPTLSPTTTVTFQSVAMGGYGAFSKYTIQVPSDWQVEKKQSDVQDLLTLTKGAYQLQVNQFGGEISQCIYPGDSSSSPFTVMYTSFINLSYNGDSSFYRRSKAQIPYPNGSTHYSICQKASDGTYGGSTKFGVIDYMAPVIVDDTILSQMDKVVLSIKPQ